MPPFAAGKVPVTPVVRLICPDVFTSEPVEDRSAAFVIVLPHLLVVEYCLLQPILNRLGSLCLLGQMGLSYSHL